MKIHRTLTGKVFITGLTLAQFNALVVANQVISHKDEIDQCIKFGWETPSEAESKELFDELNSCAFDFNEEGSP